MRTRSTSPRPTARRRRSTFEHAVIATGSRPATVPGVVHRQPARHGLDRGARSARHSEVAARRRRRLHRPRARQRLRCARLEGHRRRDDGRPAAGRRSRPRQHPRQAHQRDVRGGAAETKVVGREGSRRTGSASRSTASCPRAWPKEQTFDRVLVSVGRRPNSAVPGLDKTRRQGRTSAGFIEVDGRAAPPSRRSTRSATSSASRCWRTRRRTKPASRSMSIAGRTRRVRAAGDSGRRLHRPGTRVVRSDRDRGREAEARGHRDRVSRGRRQAARSRSIAPTA